VASDARADGSAASLALRRHPRPLLTPPSREEPNAGKPHARIPRGQRRMPALPDRRQALRATAQRLASGPLSAQNSNCAPHSL
jgi:hypothetical protein